MRALPLFVLLALLVGCAGTMLPGKLYSLDEGTALDFQIETSHGHGTMTAVNPKTGEKFTGEYTGIYEGGGVTTTRVNTFDATKAMNNRTNRPGQGYTATSYTAPNHATARGVLTGDKGTMIELYLDIQPGLRPKGHGEGTDNHGHRYQVQF